MAEPEGMGVTTVPEGVVSETEADAETVAETIDEPDPALLETGDLESTSTSNLAIAAQKLFLLLILHHLLA